jgi:Leucine rich repeat variant
MLDSSNLLALVHEAASETNKDINLEELAINLEQARATAANICTAPGILLALSTSKDYETRKAVASNPNTPTETLFQLGIEFPQELLENPVFSLLLLENPNLFQELPEDTQASLLKLEVIPDTFLQWALSYRYPKTMFAVVMNPRLTRDDLSNLIYEAGCNWSTSQVPNVAKLHVNWIGEMKAGWQDAALSVVQKHQLVKDNIGHDETSEYNLWELGIIEQSFLTGLHRNTLIKIARNPDTPASILQILSRPKTATKKMRAAIANNLNTPVHLLEKLAGDEDAWVRQTVFQNPSTPYSVYKLFYEYEAAVQNPDTTGATLSEIAKREWEYTLLGVASHPNTPREILLKLAFHKSWKVRVEVAANKSVSDEALEILIEDKRLGVRNAIVCNPATPAWLLVRMLNKQKYYRRQDIATHPNVTSAMLQLLARDADSCVRAAVTQNPNTPIELLIHLANDIDSQVRNHVARSLEIPETLLVQFADDTCYTVRTQVARNPKTPVEILAKLATDEDFNVRVEVAANSKTPIEILRKLAVDENYRVLCAVIENSNTPDDILVQLEKDDLIYVKSRATRAKVSRRLQPITVYTNSTSQDSNSIATNPNTPVKTLVELAPNDTYQVYVSSIKNICRQMTINFDISASLLEKCSTFNIMDMQIGLVRYPNIPESVASKFALSQSVRLRRLLARNPNLAQSVIEKLLQDKNQDVRRAALAGLLENRNVNIEFLKEWQVLQNPDISSTQLVELAQSKWIIIRETVALHPLSAMIVFDISEKTHSKSSKSKSHCKSDAPVTLLEKLAVDEHFSVRLAVAKNPNSPADILEMLLKNPKSNNLIHLAAVKSLIQRYPHSAKSYIENLAIYNNNPLLSNFFILLHHLAPEDLLIKYHRSSSWLERYAVATNPNTPQHIRKLLAQDANRIVRAAAKANS